VKARWNVREIKSSRLCVPALIALLWAGCFRDSASVQREQAAQRLLEAGPTMNTSERAHAWAVLRDEQQDRILRELAAGALARAQDPQIVAFIIERLPDSILRAQQIDASDRGLHPHMLAKALLDYSPSDPSVLAPLLAHADEAVVAWTVMSHGFYRRSDTSLAVLTRFLADPRPVVRGRAASGLSQLFHPKAEPVILRHLGDADADVRHGLAWALLNYGTTAALPAIDAALLAEKDKKVRSMLERARETTRSRSSEH
jgi:HEAT repeat protein